MKNKFFYLNTLHFLNDGFSATALLFLPFLAKDLALNLSQVGFLGTGINLLPIALALPAWWLAQKFGGLKVLLAALLIYIIGYFLLSGTIGFWSLLGIFILLGVAFGLFHPIAFPLVSRWSEENRIGKHMGNFTAWGDGGRLALSGMVTFIIARIGWRLTSGLYALGGLAVLILLYLIIVKKNNFSPQTATASHHNFKNLLTDKKFLLAIFAGGLDNLASSPIFLFLPFLLISKGISATFLSAFASVLLAGYILGKQIVGNFSDSVGAVKIFALTEVCMAGLIFALVFVNATWLIMAVAFLLGVMTRGTVPATRTMIHAAVSGVHSFEQAGGVTEVANMSMAAIAPLLLGAFSNSWGVAFAFKIWAVAPLLSLLPAAGFYFLSRKKELAHV